MRKPENGVSRPLRQAQGRHFWSRAAKVLTLITILLGGCATPAAKEKLITAYKELDTPAPNYNDMIAAADEYLQAEPNGADSADALYLRGRALEEKAQREPATAQKDWADAYTFYDTALSKRPRPGLAGLIHAGMGNVLYFQDRYAAALVELANGYNHLERDNDKAWVMYRIGLCNQRMGSWVEADKYFAAVQEQFPNTEQARRAREHQGAGAFWVQVATYASAKSADQATASLRRQGLTAQRFIDTSRNTQVVRVGPINSYESANATCQRLRGQYRDAIIVP
jgi:tetratricopeptide (TPR) repeat protein